MNIIQLSEQLKDVPDNFLLTEVQNPSGSYPAYLVVSELTRRKRMRANASQEAPETTVVEDLITPQQPMQPAGLGALSQPGEMAAQDAGAMQPLGMPFAQPGMVPEMAPEMMRPQMMAGGGLVAFRDGGDVVRAQSGLFVAPEEEVPMTLEEELQMYRPGRISRLIGGPQGIGAGNIRYQLGQLGYSKAEIDRMDPGMQRMIVARARPVTPAAAAPAAAVPAPLQTSAGPTEDIVPPPRQAPAAGGDTMSQIMSMIRSGTSAGEAPDRKAGLAALETALPDTASPLIRQALEAKQQEMEGRRASNLNLALMQAGLGIMGKGIAAGGMEGLKAYREGLADIEKGEQMIQASQIELAKAADARSRGLFDLQLRSEANAAQLAQQGRTSQLQGAQILASLEASKARIGARGLGDITPSPSEMKAAEDLADKRIMELVTQGQIKPASPQAAAMKQQLVQRYLAQSGKVYMPMDSPAQSTGIDFNALMGQ